MDINMVNKKKEEQQEVSAVREVLGFLRDLAVCFAVVFFITKVLVKPVQVNGESMYPTLQNDEIGVSNMIGYRISGLERFDIAIIYIASKDEYIVKRVIGLPGETVSYQAGQLYINGEVVEEPFLDADYVSSYGSDFMSDIDPVNLAEDEYYCLGDNRPHSSDSRYYGPFKKSQIECRGVFIFFPFSSFGAHTW